MLAAMISRAMEEYGLDGEGSAQAAGYDSAPSTAAPDGAPPPPLLPDLRGELQHTHEAPPIAAGYMHTLFVDASGQLLSCGREADDEGACLLSLYPGLLGHGPRVADSPLRLDTPTPVASMAGIQVRSVAAGPFHSFALGCQGELYTWGSFLNQNQCEPTLVQPLRGERVVAVAAGSKASLAVTEEGTVFSWGKLGKQRNQQPQPTRVKGLSGVLVRRVATSGRLAFAVTDTGEVFSWGSGPPGVFGHGDNRSHQPIPKRIEALSEIRVRDVALGGWHCLALTEGGEVYSWGEERQGSLGHGNLLDFEEEIWGGEVGSDDEGIEPCIEILPKWMVALSGVRVVAVAVSNDHSCAVSEAGALFTWGAGGWGQLGHGDHDSLGLPRRVEALHGIAVVSVAAADRQTFAVVEDGSVYAWGCVQGGVLGMGRESWREVWGPMWTGPAPIPENGPASMRVPWSREWNDADDDVLLPRRVPELRLRVL